MHHNELLKGLMSAVVPCRSLESTAHDVVIGQIGRDSDVANYGALRHVPASTSKINLSAYFGVAQSR